MATKKILSDVFIDGKLAIGVEDSQNLLNIEATDNNYDVSRAIEIDYTKSHTGTGWSASAFGVRTNVYADGTGQNADIQGGSFSATHNGSGVSYYLLGSQSNAKHQGSGNTGAIWGAFNQGRVTGSGTGTHPFLIGTNQKAELANANASVGSMSGILAVVKTSAGDVTGRMDAAWLQIDGNQGSTTVVDANVLYLQADVGNITASGTMRTIHSVSTLPSEFAGTIQAPTFYLGNSDNYLRENSGDVELYGDASIVIESGDGVIVEISDIFHINGTLETTGSTQSSSFVKNGGTSSQFLKADGSVDSTVYTGDQDLSGYLLLSGGTMTGDLEIPSKLIHAGDSNTFLQFYTDQLVLKAGGRNIIMMDEGADPDKIQLGDSTTVTYTEGTFGIGTTDPQEKLDISAGDIRLDDGFSINWATDDANIGRVRILGNEVPDTFAIVTDNQERLRVNNSGVGIGTNDPQAKLDVDGGIRMANDTQAAASTNVGTMRYYADAFGSYADMIMQTDTSTYGWVNVVRNTFSV